MTQRLTRLPVDDFLQRLASADPVPGGGSTAALAGAIAAALVTMVARLTVRNEKFQDRRPVLIPVEERAASLIRAFEDLVQRDTDAYQAVIQTYRLPKETLEEKSVRAEAIQKAVKEAAQVPLETLWALERLVYDAAEVLRFGNPKAASDAGAALQLIRSAAAIAAYNVWINLPGIHDPAFVAEARSHVDRALRKIEAAASQGHTALAKDLTA